MLLCQGVTVFVLMNSHTAASVLKERNGNPLQYSCLENPMDGGTWQGTVHGVERVGHDLATNPPPTVVDCVSDGKEFACNVGDPGSMPGSRRSSG